MLDHHLLYLTNKTTTQIRADQKNAELVRDFPKEADLSDAEAPEEEMSDLSDEEESKIDIKIVPVTNATHKNQFFFDGLEFYLAVSQVRERTVRSVVAHGIAKTLTRLREEQHNESIAVIEQRYPDFTCLPTTAPSRSYQQPMDLIAALQLPSANAVAQRQLSIREHYNSK
ncbi:hypothetical protein PsorP6_002806 [Peronosclerospora sorghi]|uniref:Uncharacterized protein n=1 Tax=Peronosclerospora sorghi TaxID=230839 RepID=A0ACC0VPI7_9STRA|nr:hypothetical protein PsorP6_002806 [Peronosclerospora sorghi]